MSRLGTFETSIDVRYTAAFGAKLTSASVAEQSRFYEVRALATALFARDCAAVAPFVVAGYFDLALILSIL